MMGSPVRLLAKLPQGDLVIIWSDD